MGSYKYEILPGLVRADFCRSASNGLVLYSHFLHCIGQLISALDICPGNPTLESLTLLGIGIVIDDLLLTPRIPFFLHFTSGRARERSV